jgi:hypothetical protein
VTFTLPKFQAPDFSDAVLSQAPDLVLAPAPMDGVPPEGFHLTTSFPEYYKINGQWKLPDQSIPYCCVVYKDDAFTFLECAKLQKDDPVVVAETFDGSEGVYAHRHAFSGTADDARALPYEESGSNKYGQLVDLMKYQKEHEIRRLGKNRVGKIGRLKLRQSESHGYPPYKRFIYPIIAQLHVGLFLIGGYKGSRE